MKNPAKEYSENYGGARPGSGKKIQSPTGEKMNLRTIKVTDSMWAWCKAQGEASGYIRGLIEADMQAKGVTVPPQEASSGGSVGAASSDLPDSS